MTEPRPGPYPQYPGGSGVPAPQLKPPPPDTVRNAFYMTIAGAALQALGIILALTQIDTIRARARERSDAATVDIDRAVNASITLIVVLGLIGVGVWLWMAFANRAGKNWARITATIFFGISTLVLLSIVAGGSSDGTMALGSSGTPLGTVVSVLKWLVGLAAIILLWHGRSGPYFRKPSHGHDDQSPVAAS